MYRVAFVVAATVQATDRAKSNKARGVRRSLIRYAVLSQALLFRQISKPVRKEFPSLDSLIDFGLMTKREGELYRRAGMGVKREAKKSKFLLPMFVLVFIM